MTRSTYLLLGLALVACNGGSPGLPMTPGTIPLRSSESPQRPAARFEHDAHTAALGPNQCDACHGRDDRGRVIGSFVNATNAGDATEEHHRRCIGCHDDRREKGQSTGPVTCGECHRRAQPGLPVRAAMRFDYPLHAQHVRSSGGEESCGSCHHVYDKATRKLVLGRGKEEGCSACHGEQGEGKKLSLKNASHRSCINCHLDRAAKKEPAGPTTCAGCHARSQSADRSAARPDMPRPDVPRPDWPRPDVPRPDRGQKARLVISASGATSAPVPFNHKDHEVTAPFCSTCHHKGLEPCQACHTVADGARRGGGVSLERAFHHPGSARSCVGCHSEKLKTRDCAGCHDQLIAKRPGKASCTVCHQEQSESASRPASQPASRPASRPDRAALPPLPPTSEQDFPQNVTIGVLAKEYGPSVLPHKKIVEQLDAMVRKSGLARAFHRDTGTLCQGCHHHSPVGERPTACRSCHDLGASEATDGRPGLLTSYHRQCIGCHTSMGLDTGCTSCHERAKAEGRR